MRKCEREKGREGEKVTTLNRELAVNRILFTESEVGKTKIIEVDDSRAVHMLKVLHVELGDTVRVGILDGAIGEAEVVGLDCGRVLLNPIWENVPAASSLNLLLALPRPKVLKRLWAPLASLGLNKIIITNAGKVERNYFDTHWLQPENYQPLLVEGLVQAGDTLMPEVIIRRRFKPFIEDELDVLLPNSTRILAHPHTNRRFSDIKGDNNQLLLAIGPEGGWNEFELELLKQHNFQSVSAGTRILRTDVACIALLTLTRELVA